jgi:hypothetical protein
MLPEDDIAPNHRPVWSWQGAVAVTLALGIFITIILICCGVAYKLSRGLPLASVTVQLLTAALSSLVGAAATFLGRVGQAPVKGEPGPAGPEGAQGESGATAVTPVGEAPVPAQPAR